MISADRSHPPVRPLLTAVPLAVVLGAGFGAVTALVNAISQHFADLESREATVSGASPIEILTVLLDSGWAWAGWAVLTGWLITRSRRSLPAALVLGAVVGVLSLLAATAAYSFIETARADSLTPWYAGEWRMWWDDAVLFGIPLGAAGACAALPNLIGLLARLTVPVGAAVQMVVLPPGRNEVIETIGQTIVWTAAAACAGFFVIHFLRMRSSRG